MGSIVHEFSKTYQEFSCQFPDHPLTDEIRRAIASSKSPRIDWLRSSTKRMRDLMVPVWKRDAPDAPPRRDN